MRLGRSARSSAVMLLGHPRGKLGGLASRGLRKGTQLRASRKRSARLQCTISRHFQYKEAHEQIAHAPARTALRPHSCDQQTGLQLSALTADAPDSAEDEGSLQPYQLQLLLAARSENKCGKKKMACHLQFRFSCLDFSHHFGVMRGRHPQYYVAAITTLLLVAAVPPQATPRSHVTNFSQ
jgi:hypothetical protein